MLFSYFDVNVFFMDKGIFDSELFNFMSDKSNNGSKDVSFNANGTVNINNPYLNVSVPASSLNNLAAAASVSGGGALALKVAQQVPGSPGTKLAVGAAT
jgi:hypothetical protein